MFAFVALTTVHKHGGRFLFSGMPLRRMRTLCADLCLRCTRIFVSVAWRSSNVVFLFVLPKFWLAWLSVRVA